MPRNTKKTISKLITLIMLLTVVFTDINGINIFASDTSNNRKIDIWDFGGVQTLGDLYNNNITRDILNSTTTIKSGTFTKTDFGDLSIAAPTTSDRMYYYNEDGTTGVNSYGTWGSSIKDYDDGYSSKGTYYCNGTGGIGRRYLTLKNVVAGDKISVYGGTSNGDEEIHLLYLGTGGAQDTAVYFGTNPSRADFVAKYSGEYQIYVTAAHSGKPYYHRVVRTPGVKVSGQVNLNGNNISGALLAFVNQTTGEATDVTLNSDNTFDAVLAPGYNYTAVLNGVNGYTISDTTKVVGIATTDIPDGINNISLDIVVENLATVSGNITGFDNGYDVSKLQIKLLPPKGSLSEEVDVTVDTQTMNFNAKVRLNEVYTAVLSGVNDYEIVAGGSVNITADTTQNIQVAKKAVYAATGRFIGLSSTAQVQSITFTNVDDGYTYTGTVSNGGYSVSLRDGAYSVKPVVNENYETSTHVVINGANTSKDIKLNAVGVVLEPINRVPDLYVGDSSKEPYNYETVKEALAVAARMNPTSEAERITIHIAPGTYRAQLTISTPYITLVNSNPNEEVKITWYYGIGYKYYSIGANGFYDEDRDFDKYSKNIAAKWGGTVYLTSTAKEFRAENIVFENSFNKYITDEELADGVELANVAGSSITVERKSYTDVTSRAATERAAAMLIESDNVEFYKCSFISSQDTLYTGGSSTNNIYFKDSFIEGNTDYIFGDGNVVFDNSILNFNGYSEQASGGYITAAKDTATHGYLFRNTIVTANNKNMQTAGYFGRPWGKGAKVKFLNTKLESASIIEPRGWTDMSGNTAEGASFAEYNTTYNGAGVDTASRRAPVLTDAQAAAINVVDYFGDWTPTYYAADSSTAPTFRTAPFFTTDDDINTPYPGHTINLGYEFNNVNDNLNDSSLIQWYRVAQDGTEQLIKTTVAYVSKTYKITSADSGYYIKAVVTPEITNGKKGTPMSVKLDNLIRVGSGTGGSNDIPDGELVNIFVAGDSTVKTYTTARQEAGWGEYLQKFFNSDKVKVVNYANGGRSTRNFINEGSLDKIAQNIQAGDYLLIQFGHNDSSNSSSYLLDRFVSVGVPDANGVYPSTPAVKEPTPSSLSSYGAEYYPYTSGTFKWYLQQYIDVARNAGATPILVTPVARQYFNADGTIRPHHDATDTTTGTVTSTNNAYVRAVEQLGAERGVKVIDMFTATKNTFETAYKNDSAANNGVSPLAKALMNPGDSTHANKFGGFYEGGLLAKEVQKLGYNISNNVILPTRVGGVDSYNNLLFEVDSNSKVNVFKADANGAYTSQSDTYWTGKTQDLINSLLDVPQEPVEDFTINSTFNMSSLQAGGSLNVETVVTNNKSPKNSVVVIVALYNEKNKMVKVSYMSKDVTAGQTAKINTGFQLPSNVANHKVKVLVWEGTSLTDSSMIPLADPVTLQ
jgi:pectin methylesterase-like acyl-CoA thioesterase/lysophospholipase L1-like esterase